MSGSAAVPVRRTSYPQVDPRAAGLMHRRLVVVPPGLAVAPAARLADRQRARLVVGRIGRTWAAASRDTLGRALALGLGRAPVSAVLWDGLGRARDGVRGRRPASPGTGPALPPGRRAPGTRGRRPPGARSAGRAAPVRRLRARPAPGAGGGDPPRRRRPGRRARAPRRRRGRPGPGPPARSRRRGHGPRSRRRGKCRRARPSARQGSRRKDPGAPRLPHGHGPPPGRTPGRPRDRAP